MKPEAVWAGLLAALMLLAAVPALASHYPIDAVPFIQDEHKTALAEKVKLDETETLLKAGLTGKARKSLARSTGIDLKVLTEYVYMCDLLRVRGIGPKMARLLTLAGIHSIEALRAEKAAELIPRIQAANKKHAVSEILPQEDTVKDWIHQARNLDIIVQ